MMWKTKRQKKIEKNKKLRNKKLQTFEKPIKKSRTHFSAVLHFLINYFEPFKTNLADLRAKIRSGYYSPRRVISFIRQLQLLSIQITRNRPTL